MLSAVLIIGILGCINYFAASEHIHRRLSEDEIEAAKAFAQSVRHRRATDETSREAKATKTEMPWYRPLNLDDDRYNAVGILLIAKLNKDPVKKPDVKQKGKSDYVFAFNPRILDCTAFYVAPDILATGAHCLKDNGVTPTSKHILIFRQKYDGSKPYTDELARDYERIVQDWIYLENYETKKELNSGYCYESGFDFAFLRTSGESFEKQHYTLALADQFLKLVGHTSIKILGYPNEYADYYEPVYISCKLAKGTDKIAKNDKGLQKVSAFYKEPSFLETVRDNQLFCVSEAGNLQNGGSGGPWLVDEEELKSKADQKKLRWVIGISAWSILRGGLEKDGVKDPQSYCMTTVTPWFTRSTMDVYDAIKKTPAEVSFKDTLTKSRKQ